MESTLSASSSLNLQDVILHQVTFPLSIIVFSAVAIVALLVGMAWMGYAYLVKKRLEMHSEKSIRKVLSLVDIRQQWQHARMGERKTAYFLAKILSEQLMRQSLPHSCPSILSQHNPEYIKQWQQVVTNLNALRYQGQAAPLQTHYFDWIEAWINALALKNPASKA